MALRFLAGDDQDRVYGLLDLGTSVRNGRNSIKCLLGSQKRFGLNKDDIKTLKAADNVLHGLFRKYVMELRCPDQMIEIKHELHRLKTKPTK